MNDFVAEYVVSPLYNMLWGLTILPLDQIVSFPTLFLRLKPQLPIYLEMGPLRRWLLYEGGILIQ